MAFGVENTSSTSGANVASLTWSFTTTNANKIVVTAPTGNGALPNRTIASVTFNAQALTFVVAGDDGNFQRAEIWEKHTPSMGTFDVVVTAGGGGTDMAAGATGVIDARIALGTPNSNTASSTNPTVTVVDSAANDIVISVVSNDLGTSGTQTENGTLLWEVEDLDLDSDYGAQWQTATGASTVCTWTADSNIWATVGVAVKRYKNEQQPIASLWPILVAG